jgi:hypothetical protein
VFVTFVIQYAMRVRHIVIVAYPALQYFSTFFSQMERFLKKKVTEHKTRILIFSTEFA